MSYIIEKIFKNKTLKKDSLIPYGFIKNCSNYVYKKHFDGCDLEIIVTVTSSGEVDAQIKDTNFGDNYNLYLMSDATGEFVGNVRMQYEKTLNDIANTCFKSDFEKTDYVNNVIEYIENSYGDKPEYLWESYPDYAIWRRKDNKKWYAILMKIGHDKIEAGYEEAIDIIDLRIEPDILDKSVDNNRFFRGYHMNKKHWMTIILDGRVSIKEICDYIDKSYILAKK